MRAAFGLIGILATLGVLILILAGPGGYLQHSQTAIKAGRKGTAEVNVIAGNAPDGTVRAIDTITFNLERTQAGKLRGLLVVAIVPDGAMAQRYDLKVNDLITEFGPVSFDIVQDHSDAEAFLTDAYQRGSPLTVMRDGQPMTLNATETHAMPGVSHPATPAQLGQ